MVKNKFFKVANNSSLGYEGYTELVFKMSGVTEPLIVPFLVTAEEISMPIIGYNVIEELVKGEMQKSNPKIAEMLGGSLRDVSKKKVKGLVTMIQKKVSYDEPESLGDVKVGRKDIAIPRGTNLKMKCISHCGPLRVDTPVIFQPEAKLELHCDLVIGEEIMLAKGGKTTIFLVPVSNPRSSDVVLKDRTKVGVIIPVVSVIPCPVDAELNCVDTKSNVQIQDTVEKEWLSKIDLDHLSVSRRKKVKELLMKEKGVFSKDSLDIGEIKGLKMKINLKDSEPVKKSYTSILPFSDKKPYVTNFPNFFFSISCHLR